MFWSEQKPKVLQEGIHNDLEFYQKYTSYITNKNHRNKYIHKIDHHDAAPAYPITCF